METVPLRHLKSNCRTAFETEKVWKSVTDCPCLRLFRAVKVMELTCHNLTVSYMNKINRATSEMLYASSSSCTS